MLVASDIGTLSARFPYVTPSGVVGGCHGLDPTQLIDGGYADNTGLGIILNLAPVWTRMIRDHNDNVLADGSGDLIVPMVVFLDNGSGGDYAFADQPTIAPANDTVQRAFWPKSRPIPEILVPPIGRKHAAAHKVGIRKELRTSKKLTADALCSPGAPDCDAMRKSDQLGPQVIVVHQITQPSISAPLGWVLSEASQDDILTDIAYQVANGREDLPADPASVAGYGSMRDLLDALGFKETVG